MHAQENNWLKQYKMAMTNLKLLDGRKQGYVF